jgi:hypothetical protein
MNFDLFFISYDEPMANILWQQLTAKFPHAKRVHGVKGFDAAYKACAAQSSTDRFFTVDGDNEVLPSFAELHVPSETLNQNAVLSWGAKNSINGLCYGNGGIKNWKKNLVLEMSTHESDVESDNVDFCFKIPYRQMPEILSIARIHDSPYQAFRAGFREGIKLSLVKGKKISLNGKSLKDFVWWENLDRLKIWCSIGLDRDCGIWAIYGARLGLYSLFYSDLDHSKIRDYDWFQKFWQQEVWPMYSNSEGDWKQNELIESVEKLGQEIQKKLGIEVCLLDAKSSKFFRSVYQNPVRTGILQL